MNKAMKDGESEIRAAFAKLKEYGIPHQGALESFEEMLEDQVRIATEDDQRWPLVEATDITTHLTDEDERPIFSAALVKGRAYRLSPAQRDVVRKWYNMTPAPLVEVIDVALFEPSVPQGGARYIKSVTLRSVEHIDPRRIRAMNKFTITEWGRFMSSVAARQVEIDQAKDLERWTARVATLLQHAKEQGVKHSQIGPGYLANRLQTEVAIARLDDPEQIRELLRKILIGVNEHNLAKLVKEPKYWPTKVEDEQRAQSRKIKSIEKLFEEYGV